MSRGITGPVLVCVGAAGMMIGALALDTGGDSQDGLEAASPASEVGDEVGTSTATLAVADFTFSTVTVAAGGTVTVDNQDPVPHTATAVGGAFDSGSLSSGTSGTFVAPDTPGSYPIHCEIHPEMTGVVVVTP